MSATALLFARNTDINLKKLFAYDLQEYTEYLFRKLHDMDVNLSSLYFLLCIIQSCNKLANKSKSLAIVNSEIISIYTI